MLNIKKNRSTNYAFYDVDETLITVKSMFTFINLYFSIHKNDELQEKFLNDINLMIREKRKREDINIKYYSYFKNFPIKNVMEVCELWFKKSMARTECFYNKKILSTLKNHQENNIQCVFVSGSFKELLTPIAKNLNIEHILCINLERKEDMYTGKFNSIQTIGKGKAKAILSFLERNDGKPENCFAYGDDISDVPMLEVVGNPCAVIGTQDLKNYATTKNWKTINIY